MNESKKEKKKKYPSVIESSFIYTFTFEYNLIVKYVNVDIAKQSVTVKIMLEDLGRDMDEDEPVPLPNVNAAILKKVIQWCTFHRDDPPPPEDDKNKEKRTDDVCFWDPAFLKVDQGTLFGLILAANYLDIKGLLGVINY
ncbi:S-phase kinase-associated protein 1-like [Physella acuta]|uniref:S-phase kinase-associated protein 1-like n=1 Tax=Physella acuta TaxID=109671 RepID=UPI0027DB4E01|nr:S-phase kinase-associated protein 1-like [Physella acuta]